MNERRGGDNTHFRVVLFEQIIEVIGHAIGYENDHLVATIYSSSISGLKQ